MPLTTHTPETLAAFTQRVADAFNAGEIRHPVHLHGGNERQLLDVFQDVGPEDWICSSWRSHYHCLLRGVPEDELFQAILAGRSIALCFPEHRVISSAIVGGILPIALGIAHQLQRDHDARMQEQGFKYKTPYEGPKVHCFMGDMTAMTGIACECYGYAAVNHLPIRFIIESNGKSVCTPYEAVWPEAQWKDPEVVEYDYDLPWPHSGAGKRVMF